MILLHSGPPVEEGVPPEGLWVFLQGQAPLGPSLHHSLRGGEPALGHRLIHQRPDPLNGPWLRGVGRQQDQTYPCRSPRGSPGATTSYARPAAVIVVGPDPGLPPPRLGLLYEQAPALFRAQVPPIPQSRRALPVAPLCDQVHPWAISLALAPCRARQTVSHRRASRPCGTAPGPPRVCGGGLRWAWVKDTKKGVQATLPEETRCAFRAGQ